MNNSSEIKLLIDNITELMNSNQSDNSEYDEQSEILNTALISLSVNDIKSDLSKKYIEKLLDIAKNYY